MFVRLDLRERQFIRHTVAQVSLFSFVESISGRSIGHRQMGNNIWVAQLAQDFSFWQVNLQSRRDCGEQLPSSSTSSNLHELLFSNFSFEESIRSKQLLCGVKVSLFGFLSNVSECRAPSRRSLRAGRSIFISCHSPWECQVEPAGKKPCSGAQPAGCGPHVKVLPLGQWPSFKL